MADRSNIETARRLLIAASLAELDARPPIISAICGLSRFAGVQLYKNLFGASPKTGMLPYDQFWILRSSLNCIHASIFYGIYTNLTQNATDNYHESQVFLTAYRTYQDIAAHIHAGKSNKRAPAKLDINRAWYITRQAKNGEVIMTQCEKCQSNHFVMANFPEPYRQCPVCEVWADRTGRNRWMTVSVKYKPKA